MNWIIPAIAAPAVYTIVNFIDKYIVSKQVKDYRGMPIYGTIVGFIIGTIFWIATGFPTLDLKDTIIVLLTGVLTIWGAYFYFEAMASDEASKLILWFQMTPVFILIMASIFLRETLSFQQLFGFLIVLSSVIAVSLENGVGGFRLSRNFLLIMLVNLMWGAGAILIKFAIGANSFSKILSYESWGLGLGGLILYLFVPHIRNAFLESFRKVSKTVLTVMFINEGFFVIAKSLTFFAYSLGPASLVSIVGSTQVFFGILYGYVLTIFLPKIIKEDISREKLTKKIFFAILSFLGLWLVFRFQ